MLRSDRERQIRSGGVLWILADVALQRSIWRGEDRHIRQIGLGRACSGKSRYGMSDKVVYG